MSLGFGFGFPRRLTSGGGLSPSLYLDFVGTGVLPSTVTFSRGTNATLTDSNGRVAWAPHNLLTNSEDFEAAAWQKLAGGTGVAPVVTANAGVAPDGTTTADRVVLNRGAGTTITDTSILFQNTGTLTGVGMLSVWMRSFDGVSSYSIRLLNGFGETNVTVTPAWQRFQVVSTSLVTNAQIAVRGDQNQQNADILIWGAQLNVANAPVNLLTWSEQFDNAAWGNANTTVTANAAVAPDGTTTADLLFPATTGTFRDKTQQVTASSAVYVASCFLKASGFRWAYFRNFAASNFAAHFDLQNGVLGTVQAGFTATITNAGNGWYRCTLTSATPIANPWHVVGMSDADNSSTATASGSNGILAWGAQLNTGSVALPYVATTSSIYLPPAYNSTTPKNLLGFTQEPENATWTKSNSYVQQNLLLQSNDFLTSWTPTNITRTLNSITSPSGSVDGVKIEATAGAVTTLFQTATVLATSATASVYVKQGTGATVANSFNLRNATTSTTLVSGTLNYSTGVFTYSVGSTGVVVTDAGNGWWRIALSATSGITSGDSIRFFVGFLGSTETAGTYLYAYGAQLVQGSTAGDYTQTTSAAAPTRYLNYDGTLTGRKLVEDTATSQHRINQGVAVTSGTPCTFSFYAKPAERSYLHCRIISLSAVATAAFDLSSVTTVASAGTSTIAAVGGGWYRCTITGITDTTSATGYVNLATSYSTATPSYTGDGTSGIYVSDFQLSNSASVDPYVYNPQAAAASAAFYGPRFDYNPTGTPVLGPELVTNGDFSSTANWTTGAGWSISGGVAIGASASTNLLQSNVAPSPVGKTYQVTLTVVSRTAGSIVPQIGGSFFTISAAGTYTFFLTPSLSDATFYIPGSGFSGTIDNVSVREVTGYTATANGLLIEEQRTNLLTYSEQFDNATWTKNNATVTANAAVAPDGTTTADKLVASLSALDGNTFQTPTLAANTTYTESVYCKKAEWSWVMLQTRSDTTDTLNAFFNLDTGVIGTVDAGGTATITNIGNGWYRCSLTRTTNATVASPRARIFPTNANNVVSTGDGTSGIFIWGAQLEAGSFATSYIPTVASQVTRNADSASMLGDNFYTWYNPNQGTLSAEWDSNEAGNGDIIGVSDGTANNFISAFKQAALQFTQYVVVGGSVVVSQSRANTYTVGAVYKNALSYKANDFASTLNGGSVSTTTSGNVPAVNKLNIGANATLSSEFINGHIRRIGYYNTRLPNATLQALTV